MPSAADGFAIGPYRISNRALVAPMAGVTDRPFRQLCKRLGASYAVSEMAASNPRLWHSVKTARRIDHDGEAEPRAVQIAGADPTMMAEAARFNVDRGAQVIDINMGCPAKKVCNVSAGSALMSDERLALAIIEAVVAAVAVPVTLKMRTGVDPSRRNAPALARAAEQAGIAMITVHGRSRACRFVGPVDLHAIADVRERISIPLVANGDIDSAHRAREVLALTGADAVMIGRAAQGRPWIFREIDHHLRHGTELAPPTLADVRTWLRDHLLDHYRFYGEDVGVRTARKHIGWYLRGLSCVRPEDGNLPPADSRRIAALQDAVNTSVSARDQLGLIDAFFEETEQTPNVCLEPDGVLS